MKYSSTCSFNMDARLSFSDEVGQNELSKIGAHSGMYVVAATNMHLDMHFVPCCIRREEQAYGEATGH